jgi:DNA-binding XRE family transcriptional regulator
MIDREQILSDEALGARLRALRKNRKLTQEQLARLAALSPDTIRRMERGEFSPNSTPSKGARISGSSAAESRAQPDPFGVQVPPAGSRSSRAHPRAQCASSSGAALESGVS